MRHVRKEQIHLLFELRTDEMCLISRKLNIGPFNTNTYNIQNEAALNLLTATLAQPVGLIDC